MSFDIVKLVDPIQFTNVSGGLVPKGVYNPATDYAVGDSVSYNGSSYVMHADAAAGTLPTNTSYWQVLAEKGTSGTTGSVIAGGTANQALTKIDSTDGNVQWSIVDRAFVGLGNVDNTSDATKDSATATLSNKTLASPKVNAYDGIYNGATKVLEIGSYGTPVNMVGVEAAPTGADVTVYATGADADISINAQSKGTGRLKSQGVVVPTISSTDTLTNKTLNGVNIADASNVIIGSTTGTKIGTATNQKLGFFNAAPVVQQTATTDLGTALSNLGLRATGTAYPLSTSGAAAFTGGFRQGYTTRSANVTLTTTSVPLNACDATTAAFTATLPTTTTTGIIFTIKKTDATANAVTVKAGAAGTIDGANTYVLSTQYKYVTVVSTATPDLWYIVANN